MTPFPMPVRRESWRKLKQRLKEEGNETVTNCHQLKLVSPKDGKRCLRRMIKVIGYRLLVNGL